MLFTNTCTLLINTFYRASISEIIQCSWVSTVIMPCAAHCAHNTNNSLNIILFNVIYINISVYINIILYLT